MAVSDVIQAVERYLGNCGRDYPQWCTGVAADPLDQMLRVHGVAEEGDGCGWITYHCESADVANKVRTHYIARGMKAAACSPDATTTSIFVFKITSSTRL